MDLDANDVQAMIQLNVVAVSALTHLYGKEMKEQRRGRMLMVSSVCGAVAGIPSVAVYSATKAFEKTLSISMAKELEKFGVGMTCLIPGAVSETDFRKRSHAEDALCWKIPYYPKSARCVAEVGVRAMLMGDSEVTPGWMNRAFLKVLMPIVPQRLHNWVAEIMWSPINLPLFRTPQQAQYPRTTQSETPKPKPLVKFQSPPRVLVLEEPKQEQLVQSQPADPAEPVVDKFEETNQQRMDDVGKDDVLQDNINGNERALILQP